MSRFRPALKRLPKPSPALLIGLLALAVATTGTAAAATGTLVNIADGTTAANVAKVDSTGALRTSVASGTVGARPVAPTSVFRVEGAVSNFYGSGTRTVVMGPTSATVAITRAQYTVTSHSGSTVRSWDGAVFQVPGSTSSECSASAALRRKAVVSVPLGDTIGVEYGDAPLMLRPVSGSPSWCLVASFGPSNFSASESGTFWTDFTGYVVSGTLSQSAASASANAKTATGSAR